MNRFTLVKLLPLILSTLLLTSCSGPDSSGGVEFSKTANAFPFGDCRGSGHQTHSTEKTGCGWINVNEKSYYIMPHAYLTGADLSGANLSGANLSGVLVNSSTICPNGKPWGVGLNVSCMAAGLPDGPTSRIPVLCD